MSCAASKFCAQVPAFPRIHVTTTTLGVLYFRQPQWGSQNGKRRHKVNKGLVQARVKDWPGELIIDGGRLFCNLCRVEVCEDQGACGKHIDTQMHQRAKAAAAEHRQGALTFSYK
jgi:hypothetical protein